MFIESDSDNHDNIITLLIGKDLNQAKIIYNNIRVCRMNDMNLCIIQNYLSYRCNVHIKNNIIVEVLGFY